MKQIIAVDIDNVICIEEKPYKSARPIEENIEKVNELSKKYKIYLYTSRRWCDYDLTKAWLMNNKVKYDKLIMGKLKYDKIVDDKAIDLMKIK